MKQELRNPGLSGLVHKAGRRIATVGPASSPDGLGKCLAHLSSTEDGAGDNPTTWTDWTTWVTWVTWNAGP